MQVFGFIYALIKAIPKLKDLWDQFIAFYIENELKKMRKEDREAIRKAIDGQDQRDLEDQLFNNGGGEQSNVPGAVIRDGLPNVRLPKTNKSRNKR